jgi:hypothetical protein
MREAEPKLSMFRASFKNMRVLTCHVLIPNIGQRLLFFSSGPACYKANTGSFPASQPPGQLVISARAPKSQQTKILLQPSLLVQNTSATHGTRQSGVPKDAHSELLHKTCMQSSALASPAAHGLLSHPGSGAVHAGISSAAAGQVTGRDNRGRQRKTRKCKGDVQLENGLDSAGFRNPSIRVQIIRASAHGLSRW